MFDLLSKPMDHRMINPFNPRTDGGRADIRPPPRRFFVDNGKTAAA